MGQDYSATADYFDTRAKKARHEEERARFRMVAAKYRRLARAEETEAEAQRAERLPTFRR